MRVRAQSWYMYTLWKSSRTLDVAGDQKRTTAKEVLVLYPVQSLRSRPKVLFPSSPTLNDHHSAQSGRSQPINLCKSRRYYYVIRTRMDSSTDAAGHYRTRLRRGGMKNNAYR